MIVKVAIDSIHYYAPSTLPIHPEIIQASYLSGQHRHYNSVDHQCNGCGCVRDSNISLVIHRDVMVHVTTACLEWCN